MLCDDREKSIQGQGQCRSLLWYGLKGIKEMCKFPFVLVVRRGPHLCFQGFSFFHVQRTHCGWGVCFKVLCDASVCLVQDSFLCCVPATTDRIGTMNLYILVVSEVECCLNTQPKLGASEHLECTASRLRDWL